MVTTDPVEMQRTFVGPWNGDSKIVVGIDIGTTFSGVAFAFLQKGSNQQLYRVDHWPGQGAHNFSGKIPTLIWYDSEGKAVSVGAEALDPEVQVNADEKNWRLAEQFKLHLHPSHLRTEHGIEPKPLPAGVDLKQIYSDFLGYLYKHTQECFERVIGDGKTAWQNYEGSRVFVIAHPNGWALREQKFLRDAAVQAGFVTAENAVDRVRFVTEAEASVHFCLHYTNLRSCLQPEKNFAVCDAGGSTVDTTLYKVEKLQPRLQLSEVRASACVQAGAIFVNDKAKGYLRQLFEAPDANLSPEQVDEYVRSGVEHFEANAKREFSNDTSKANIVVASRRCRNQHLGIRGGMLTLEGTVVQSFFDPYIKDILASVQSHVLSTEVSYMFLVGGFGANPYLRQQLQARFEPNGCQIIIANEATSKAVADGAVIWHCANNVVKRSPRFAYGTSYAARFDPTNPEHRIRTKCETPTGPYVGGAWSEIVAKDIPVDCDAISRHSYSREFGIHSPRPDKISDDIYGYAYGGVAEWLANDSGELNEGFQKICTVTANLSDMRGALALALNLSRNVVFFSLSYDLCIRFGRTELEAFIEWEEEGTTKTGPATVIPISDIE